MLGPFICKSRGLGINYSECKELRLIKLLRTSTTGLHLYTYAVFKIVEAVSKFVLSGFKVRRAV